MAKPLTLEEVEHYRRAVEVNPGENAAYERRLIATIDALTRRVAELEEMPRSNVGYSMVRGQLEEAEADLAAAREEIAAKDEEWDAKWDAHCARHDEHAAERLKILREERDAAREECERLRLPPESSHAEAWAALLALVDGLPSAGKILGKVHILRHHEKQAQWETMPDGMTYPPWTLRRKWEETEAEVARLTALLGEVKKDLVPVKYIGSVDIALRRIDEALGDGDGGGEGEK